MDADQLTPGHMPAKHRSALFLAPVALLVMAFAVRAIGLADQSLWYDEGYSIMLAQQEPSRIVSQVAALDLNTPLHYLLLHLWIKVAGSSEFVTRLLSVFAGTITVALAYPLIRLTVPRSTAARHWAMLLITLWPVCVAMSQEARMYALLLCLGMLSVVQLMYCLRVPQQLHWWIWAGYNLAAFGTHVLGIFMFTAQAAVVGIWWMTRSHAARPRVAMLSLVGTGACLLVWAASILSQISTYGTTYNTRLHYAPLLLQSLAGNLLPRLQPEGFVIPAAVICLSVILLSMLGGPRLRILAMVVTFSVAGAAMLGALTGKFAPRYAAMTAPLVAAELGMLMSWPMHRQQRLSYAVMLVSGGAISALCIVGVVLIHTDARYANEDFRGASSYLHQHLADDETILLVSGHFEPVFQYYYGQGNWHPIPADPMLNVQHVLDYASTAPLLNRALEHKKGAWLLLWQDREIDPTGVVQMLLGRIAHQLQPDMTLLQFHGLRLLHYRFDTLYEPIPEVIPQMDSQIDLTDRQHGLQGLGCHQFRPTHTGDTLMEVACFWRVQPSTRLPYDTQVSLRLVDRGGMQVAHSDQMLAQPLGLPSVPFEKPLTSFYFVPVPGDLSAGTYTLRAIPYIPAEEISPQITTHVEILPH